MASYFSSGLGYLKQAAGMAEEESKAEETSATEKVTKSTPVVAVEKENGEAVSTSAPDTAEANPPIKSQESDSPISLEDEIAAEKQNETFNPDLMNRLLKASLDENSKTVNAVYFLAAIEEVPKLMGGLTSILKAGNSALMDKINIVRQRLAETAAELGVNEKEVSLQDIFERDIKHKWTHTGKKDRRATRNIIRLVWFLDFIVALFSHLAEYSNSLETGKNSGVLSTMKDIVLECWNTTLGPKNKYAVHLSTKQLIKLAPFPAIEDFFKFSQIEALSNTEKEDTLRDWAGSAEKVAANQWTYIKSKKLEKVP